MNNRLWNAKNPHQGEHVRVLTVCSAGLLRSPTLAWILSNEPFNFNTRAVGIDEGHALIPMDIVHLKWADIIIAVNQEVADAIVARFSKDVDFDSVDLHVLSIPDAFAFRDDKLVEIATAQVKKLFPVIVPEVVG